jgi:Bacterial regulatory proteins, luxR family
VQDASCLDFDVLSVRERHVTLRAANALANEAIAREPNINEITIKLYLHKVYWTLGIKGALAWGLVFRPEKPGLEPRPLLVKWMPSARADEGPRSRAVEVIYRNAEDVDAEDERGFWTKH